MSRSPMLVFLCRTHQVGLPRANEEMLLMSALVLALLSKYAFWTTAPGVACACDTPAEYVFVLSLSPLFETTELRV
jgi:hypothetical protein